jgi:hypothetical protein
LMGRFFDAIRRADSDLNDAIAALRSTHGQMSGALAPPPATSRSGAA